MKTYYFLILLLAVSCKPGPQEPVENEWIQLFNGKDLTGWDIKISGFELNDNFNNTFRVEDGILKASYDQYESFNGEFGHLITKKKFSHYILRVEYRFAGEQITGGPDWGLFNNGAMLHSQSAESMELNQDFPVSIEAQFLGGYGEDERTTSNVCTPGTHIVMNGELITSHCNSSGSKTYPANEWVTAEMIVLGDSIIHHVLERDTVLTYTQPQIGGDLPEGFPLTEGTLLKEGHIAIQAESHATEFRKVELLDLSKK
ncbi:MAG: DUF1080 domain-containing protein [Bacteroidetes bacterium]|nr:DUF1080 domain-containing protein [Bacteroidota bacterium]